MLGEVTLSEVEGKKDDADTGKRRQRTRSIAIGLGLFLLVALFYAATIVHMGANIAKRAF